MNFIKNILNIFYPYMNVMLIISFLYTLALFMKKQSIGDKEKFQSEENEMMNKSLKTTFVFHYLSFITIFFNRFMFLKEDLNLMLDFLLYANFSFIGIILFVLICKKLFKEKERWIFFVIAFLVDVGFVVLYRLNNSMAKKQLYWFALGMVLIFFIPLFFRTVKRTQKLKWMYISISILLLLLTFLFGTEIYGAKNWLSIGGVQFQPSEFVKIAFVFYVSSFLVEVKNIKDLYIPSVLIGVILVFLLLQRDLGSVLLYSMVLLSFVHVSFKKKRIAGIMVVLGFIGVFLSYLFFYHFRVRVSAWLNPWEDVANKGYQIAQSLFAIGHGGWFGVGIEQGMPNQVPIIETDFIFAAICEELGVLFGIGIILLFITIVYRIFEIAIEKKAPYEMLLLVGFASMIGIQTFIIIGGVIKLIPLTGITLPFISYGGSSMVTNMLIVGILAHLTKKEYYFEKDEDK